MLFCTSLIFFSMVNSEILFMDPDYVPWNTIVYKFKPLLFQRIHDEEWDNDKTSEYLQRIGFEKLELHKDHHERDADLRKELERFFIMNVQFKHNERLIVVNMFPKVPLEIKYLYVNSNYSKYLEYYELSINLANELYGYRVVLNLSLGGLENIPTEFFNIKKLEGLFLMGNQIDTFPDEIQCANDLIYIDITDNCFKDVPRFLLEKELAGSLEIDGKDSQVWVQEDSSMPSRKSLIERLFACFS